MIEVYSAPTSNGVRVQVGIEESGLPYSFRRVDLAKGDQKRPEHLALDPLGRIPVIVDPRGDAGGRLVLTQSTAILLHLAERSGRMLPSAGAARARALEWLAFAATDLGAMFTAWVVVGGEPANAEARRALHGRALAFVEAMDRRLADSRFLAGDDFTVADAAAFGNVWRMRSLGWELPGAGLARWADEVAARPAVARGLALTA